MEIEPENRRLFSLVRRFFGRLRPERVELVRENLENREAKLIEREARLEARRNEHAKKKSKKRQVFEGSIEVLDAFFSFGDILLRLLLNIVRFLLEALADV